MQIAVIFVALVAVAVAAPVETLPKIIRILEQDEVHDELGQFSLSYLSEDGTKVTQQGRLVPTADGKDSVLILSGSEEHTAPNGQVFRLSYTSDALGFHPVGEHLPVPPFDITTGIPTEAPIV